MQFFPRLPGGLILFGTFIFRIYSFGVCRFIFYNVHFQWCWHHMLSSSCYIWTFKARRCWIETLQLFFSFWKTVICTAVASNLNFLFSFRIKLPKFHTTPFQLFSNFPIVLCVVNYFFVPFFKTIFRSCWTGWRTSTVAVSSIGISHGVCRLGHTFQCFISESQIANQTPAFYPFC